MKNYIKIWSDKILEKIVKWYSEKRYQELFEEIKIYGYWSDNKRHYNSHLFPVEAVYETIKRHIKRMDWARINGVQVFIYDNSTSVIIYTGHPGLVVGYGGETIKAITEDLEAMFHSKVDVQLNETKSFAFAELY